MSCPHEDQLLDALRRGFIAAELEEHVASCPSCTELRLVAGALLDDRADAIAIADVPAAGAMLWRMRVRARREAEARARQSLLLGHAATLAVAIALVVFFFGPILAASAHQFAGIDRPLVIAVAASLLLAAATAIGGWMVVRR